MPSSYTLGEHFERFVKAMIASGRYASASEVMRDGLRLMEERERLREAKLRALRDLVQDGLDSGPAVPLDIDDIRNKARKRKADNSARRA